MSALNKPNSEDPEDPKDKDPIIMTDEKLLRSSSISTIVQRPKAQSVDTDSPAMQRFARRPLRRSSSRIRRWVQDQQILQASPDSPPDSPDSSDPPSIASNCHPYLAYPHLSALSLSKRQTDHIRTQEPSVIDDRGTEPIGLPRPKVPAHSIGNPPPPSIPRKAGALHGHTIFTTPPSLRNFHLTFSHSRNPSAASISSQSPSISRSSISQHPTASPPSAFPRNSAVSSSIYISRPSRVPPSELTSSQEGSSKTWKFKRPTVLGHFPVTLSEGQADDTSPPRPSTSSIFTHSSATTTYAMTSTDTIGALPRLSLGSLRSRSPTSFFRSSPSLWSLPTDATHMNDAPDSTKVVARDYDNEKLGSLRIPLPYKGQPSSVPVLSSVSSILSSPKRRKKRKLIISGIPAGDQRRLEAVRKWCESFGELSQITRVSNGDLHIDFRRAEVADTVCRLNARVYIGGAGSVGLSWFTGKRP